MAQAFVELLEPRTLFAGVTILATGRLGSTNGWVQTVANEITARLGGPSQVPQYVLTINAQPGNGNLVPSIQHVAGTATPQTSTSGEIILIVDYYSISANPIYPASYIGSVIANVLTTTPVDGVLLASLPIHEIGFSRGAGILDSVSQTLGQSGIWVDQQTYLDPDPVAAQGDPPATVYDNVAFADDYWRTDGTGSQEQNGSAIAGADDLNVQWVEDNSAGYSTPHLAPAGYYVGTIDPAATQSGEGPIYSNWYGSTSDMPAQIRPDSCIQVWSAPRPASGVWAASGGGGVRTAAGQAGTQWGNLTDLTLVNGTTISTGGPIDVTYIQQDRGSADTITFYLDPDRNPYNNNSVATLATISVPQANSITQGSQNYPPLASPPVFTGCAPQITNAQGQTRYAYNAITSPLTIQDSNSAAIYGRVLLKNQITAATGASSAGFRIVLTQHLKHAKVRKFVTFTDAIGGFAFNDISPMPMTPCRSCRKGYKLAPHTSAIRRVSTKAGTVTSGLTFSEISSK